MSVLVEDIGAMKVSIGNAEKNAEAARLNVHALRQDLATQAAEQVKERKTDRRWFVGTALTVTSIIIAALTVIVSNLA